MKPVADPHLRTLVPPLTSTELAALEETILRDGCRDPVVVWKGRGVILDGHHRREVCERHGVPYKVVEIDLPDEAAARLWVVRNTLARRNLTPMQRAELALALKPLLAAEAEENQRRGRGSGVSGRQKPDKPRDVKIELAAVTGVSHDTIAKVEAIRDRGGQELVSRVRRGELSVNQGYQILKRQETEAKREARREENRRLVETAPTIEVALAAGARFATIVADPPWEYEGDLYGRGRPEFATMPIEAICAYLDPRYAADDAHLYLWVTFAFLVAGHRVMDAWGFRPRGLLVWRKPGLGMGQYFRRMPEFVLFGVKGSLPLKRQDIETVFDAPRCERHSAKPAAFRDIVESCSPGPYLELFARKDALAPARPDWTYVGAEAPAA